MKVWRLTASAVFHEVRIKENYVREIKKIITFSNETMKTQKILL